MVTTGRLKATRGHGWFEHLDHDGRVVITGDPEGARQWASRAQVDAVRWGRLMSGAGRERHPCLRAFSLRSPAPRQWVSLTFVAD